MFSPSAPPLCYLDYKFGLPACIISTPHEYHDQCLFYATQPSHHPTSQFHFVYALGLVCLISHCYAVPQASVLYAPKSLSACAHLDSPSPLLTLLSPVSCRLTGHRPVHAAPLCTYRSATSALRLHHVFGLPSSLRCVLMHYVFNDPSKGEYPGARVGSGVVGRRRGVSLAEELSVIHCVRFHLHLLRRLMCCLPMHMVVVYRIYSIVL